MDLKTTANNLLDDLKNKALFRSGQPTPSDSLDFCGNDYLCLSYSLPDNSSLIETLPSGSGASRMLGGLSKESLRLEAEFAQWKNAEAGTFFSSGYQANLAVMGALRSLDAHFYSDELIHASLIDGLRLAKSHKTIYPHLDLDFVANDIALNKIKSPVILTEGVFSMNGDGPDLEKLSDLSEQAMIVLDEAHSLGLFGRQGSGLSDLIKTKENLISVNPCGKSLGVSGAVVCSPTWFKQLMENMSRSLIYSTSPSPVVAALIGVNLKRLKNMDKERRLLQDKIKLFKNALNFRSNSSKYSSPIVPIIVGSNEGVLNLKNHLLQEGFYVGAVRSPTVAVGQERLRVVIHSNHTENQLSELAQHINLWMRAKTEINAVH